MDSTFQVYFLLGKQNITLNKPRLVNISYALTSIQLSIDRSSRIYSHNTSAIFHGILYVYIYVIFPAIIPHLHRISHNE